VDSRITFKNGSTIKIVGSENWAAANGLTPDFVVYDEFKVFHTQFHNEMNPNRIVRKAPLVIIGTPPKTGDRNADQYMEFADECTSRDDCYHITASSYDNPFTPKEEVDREIEKLRIRGEEDIVQREYYGKIVRGGKSAIFPMFSKEVIKPHSDIISEIMRDRNKMEWFCVCDPGSTTCFAVLFGCINPYTKKMYLLDEIYETKQENTSVRRMFPRIKAKMQEFYPGSSLEDDWIKVYDEAAAWFAVELLNQFNLYFLPTAKHMNKKENGLSLIKDQLIYNLVTISDRCVKLTWEMEGYSKNDKGDIPKKDDHLIDCYRYLNAASNYNMLEVLESIKEEKPNDPRYVSLEQDIISMQKEEDWTFGFDDWI
jgi:hypothetical protein